MARKVIWAYEATADLDVLTGYIARDSFFYATAFVQEILTASRSLDQFAERGRIVPELCDPNVRELFVGDYRLIYAIEEHSIDILGLIHGRRDLKRLWEREQRER